MSRLQFPSVRTAPARTTAVTVYTDAACTTLADILDATSRPLPGAKLDIGPDGQLPVFYGPNNINALYARTPSGAVTVLHPELAVSALTVTGSKAGNAALTSLMGALSAVGHVVDATT